jgi:RecA-family ATPase
MTRPRIDAAGDVDETIISPPRPKPSGRAGSTPNAAPAPLPPLQWLDMRKWDEEPAPERQWSVPGRIPARQAGLFSGEGGRGKSVVELQRAVAHVLGRDWLGSLPTRGPAIYLGAEDEEDEIRRRLAAIAGHYDATFGDLVAGGLYVLPMVGRDATLVTVSRAGKIEATALYRQLYEAAGDLHPTCISIDTLSHTFAGNEIDRIQVYGFMRHMQALATVTGTAGGSVTVLSHPSLSGIQSGTGISGSTAWHGAARFRMYLTVPKKEKDEDPLPDPDLRELHWLKNQYGPANDVLTLRWQNGVFLPEGSTSFLDRAARDVKAEDLFLTLLQRYEREGRHVGATRGTIYAPPIFAAEPEARAAGLSSRHLADAMARLFAANRIRVETSGPPSKRRSRIVVA